MPTRIRSKNKNKMDDMFATFEDENEFDWLPYFDLGLKNIIYAESDLSTKTRRKQPLPVPKKVDWTIPKLASSLRKTLTATQWRKPRQTWTCGEDGVPTSARPEKWKKNPPGELDKLLCHFFINVRRHDGTDFEPGTLTSFQCSFDRHLRNLGKNYCLFDDKVFAKSRETQTVTSIRKMMPSKQSPWS